MSASFWGRDRIVVAVAARSAAGARDQLGEFAGEPGPAPG
ncbi:hypothetical protein I551_1818 [Mycobacterium ulcerans str. Harvey]|uniref:Uncharacterized protein n=1 Tax=Mycobacterium ulcerans str. Harvey TaxID=1299332 RepID=A0ABN0R3L0_MYCUL|nr:hypothetical protein I551_1818 [Mycobacterium ulcerans str. Harvey]